MIERIDSTIARCPLCTVATTRRLEAAAARAGAPFSLMAGAGDAVARLALALAPHAGEVVVFAGPGNNGGDGVEAARRLRQMGKTARVRLLGDLATLPADAARALAHAQAEGVAIDTGPGPEPAGAGDARSGLVVDALLGLGATRPPEGELALAIDRIAGHAAAGATVLAVDLPSGLDPDRGQPLGAACVVAHHTLALIAAKPGLFTAAGRDHAGTVWLDRLGIEVAPGDADAWLVGRRGVCAAARRHAQHKGSFGNAAVVGGAPGMAGAAILAARAAHAAGAGRVFVDLLDDAGANRIDADRPELMLRPGWWQGSVEAIAESTVVCGCGGGDAVRAALPRLLAVAPRLVLDADALNAIAGDESLRALLARRAARAQQTILTPHPLEAARLLGCAAAEVQRDRLAAAHSLADRHRAVIVLKGSGTVVAGPGETPCIAATGNAGLAGAGTGDVLAGWIGGRWLPGLPAFGVALQAVVEHGAAAEPERPGALRAGDLIDVLHRQSRAATTDRDLQRDA